MNIQLFTPNLISNYKMCRSETPDASNAGSSVSNLSLKRLNNVSSPNLKPLAKDTVSFGSKRKVIQAAADEVQNVAKTKVLEYWDPDGANYEQIIQIAKSFKEPLDRFVRTLRQEMRHLVATDAQPNNPIAPGISGIKGRVKTPHSIAEKANSRKLFTAGEIEKMGDVGGARIVLRDASQKNIALVFDALANMVKKGAKVKEVENYRLNPHDSYVAQNTLNKFETLCQKNGQYPGIRNQPLQNAYNAIHVSFELPDGKVIELQIMGRDMENVKDVEDFFYKWRCGQGKKKFDPKYKPIQKLFEKYMPALDEFQKTTLSRYIKDSYEHARHIPVRPAKYKFNPSKDFLPFPYSLPQELSYVNLYRMMGECSRNAKTPKK